MPCLAAGQAELLVKADPGESFSISILAILVYAVSLICRWIHCPLGQSPGRGVKLIFTGGHVSLVVAFKGLNVISDP